MHWKKCIVITCVMRTLNHNKSYLQRPVVKVSWICLIALYKVLLSYNGTLVLVSSGLGKEMKNSEIIKNVSVAWVEKMQGSVAHWLERKDPLKRWSATDTVLWRAVAVPRSCHLYEQCVSLKELSVSLKAGFDFVYYLVTYPSWETIQMQVVLAHAQNTQNCFKYPTKPTVNRLLFHQDELFPNNVTSERAL